MNVIYKWAERLARAVIQYVEAKESEEYHINWKRGYEQTEVRLQAGENPDTMYEELIMNAPLGIREGGCAAIQKHKLIQTGQLRKPIGWEDKKL